MFTHTNNTRTKNWAKKSALLTVLCTGVLAGCASKSIDKTPSQQIYHAPAQAYNLNLGNPAIYGMPQLKESCSEKGSTLEIKDKVGGYYKIDVINLLADTGLSLTQDKETAANAIAAYYRKLYGASSKSTAPVQYIKYLDEHLFYIPLVLEQSDTEKKGKVVGLLASKQKDYLFVVQHVQNLYNKKQMLQSLLILQHNMRIPGKFAVAPKKSSFLAKLPLVGTKNKAKETTGEDAKKGFMEQPETLGFISINPKTATAEQLADWRKKARCY